MRAHRILTRLASTTAVLVASTAVVVLGATPAANAGTPYPYQGTTSIASGLFGTGFGPLGIAASGSNLYATGPYFGPQGNPQPAPQQYVDVVNVATGQASASYAIPSMLSSSFCTSQGNSCPPNFYVEPAVAVSAGLGGFPVGEVYITQGPNIYEMAPGGGPLSLFTTVPGLFPNVPLSGPYPEYAGGATFDTVGSFGYEMIVTSPNGSVYKVASDGTSTEVGNVGTVVEGPAVAPASFVEYAGDLLVGAEILNEVIAVSPAGVSTEVASVPGPYGAEGVQVVPNPTCGIAGAGGADYAWFDSLSSTNTIGALPVSDFSGLAGDVLVQGEDSGLVSLLTSTSTTSTTTADFVNGLPGGGGGQEDATMVQCASSIGPANPNPTGSALTIGFWHNKNGNHVLDPEGDGDLDSPQFVVLGSGSFSVGVTTLQASNDIVGHKNTCAYFSCTQLSAGLQPNTFAVLVAQTLGLAYNIADTGFQGLDFSTDCSSYLTPSLRGLGLSSGSTVVQVFNVAEAMIASSGPGGTTTQTEAGDMNSLLGQCVNQDR